MTGNKSDQVGNSKLMSFGVQNQGFVMNKEGNEITMNMFGVTIGSYNKFEEVYKFLMRTKNTVLKVTDNVKNALDEETYIKAMKDAVENAKFAPMDNDKSFNDNSDINADDFNHMINAQPKNNFGPQSSKVNVKERSANKNEAPRSTAQFGNSPGGGHGMRPTA
jgi:hypothetical protein